MGKLKKPNKRRTRREERCNNRIQGNLYAVSKSSRIDGIDESCLLTVSNDYLSLPLVAAGLKGHCPLVFTVFCVWHQPGDQNICAIVSVQIFWEHVPALKQNTMARNAFFGTSSEATYEMLYFRHLKLQLSLPTYISSVRSPSIFPSLHQHSFISVQLRSFKYHDLNWQWMGYLSPQTTPRSRGSNWRTNGHQIFKTIHL